MNRFDYEFIRDNNETGWQIQWRNLLEGRFIVQDNELIEDPNAQIFNIGFTVDEVSNAIAFSGYTNRESEWFESQPDRYVKADGIWSEIDGWLAARQEKLYVENETKRVALLWQAAHNYEYTQISGSAVGLITIGLLKQKPKCTAVQEWITSIWNLYYERKENGSSDVDFSCCGAIPYTVPELMAEVLDGAT